MQKIDPKIFRAYDIRGIALTQLTVEAANLIGKGFGSTVREISKKDHPKIVVGRDARTHSPHLERAMIDGLKSTGCHVLKIGMTPSPVNYCTICEQKLDGGVQITASHNPKEDNGVKLQIHDAEAYSGDDLQILRERIEREDFLAGEGGEEEIDGLTPYVDRLSRQFADAAKGMKIAVDGGNGIAGPTAVKILNAIGADVTQLFIEPDGTFPNHPADPSKAATLKDLQETVMEKTSDIGFAFDGDGDRLGVVDETGAILSADDILLLFAKDHLSRHAGSTIVFTVSNSGILESEIKKLGGKPIMCKVGHSFVEHAMREHRSKLGGEQSGHFFLGEDYYDFDDATMAMLHMVKILGLSGKKLSELTHEHPKVFQMQELRPFCPDDKKTEIVKAVTEHFQKSYPVNTLDGARIDFGDNAWAGIRQSNTSPCVSICIEARSKEKLEEVKAIVLDHMKEYSEVKIEG